MELLIILVVLILAAAVGIGVTASQADRKERHLKDMAAWDDEIRQWAASRGLSTKTCPDCQFADVPVEANVCRQCGFRFRGG
jgi:hypothetical protein